MPAKEALARGYRRLAWRAVHRAWQAAQQAGAITAATPAGRRFAAFGPGSIIAFPTGALYGEAWMEVGEGSLIGAQGSPTAGMVPGHELGDSPVLRLRERGGVRPGR